MSHYWKILLPLPHMEAFDYLAPEGMKLSAGQLVQVPFRHKEMVGVVWEQVEHSEVKNLKTISSLIEGVAFTPVFCRFLRWVSDYVLQAPGGVLRMAMPVPALFTPSRGKTALAPAHYAPDLPPLSEDQQQAVGQLVEKLHSHRYSATLLDGVTGSGKTEVYFSVIAEMLKEPSGQVLILLPEITLTSQLLMRFEERFGAKPAVWHSDIAPKMRKLLWHSIAKGETRLVIGARSALFLPFPHLRMIIVDEEHEAAFKQEEGVIYHGRDMAIVRAHIEKIPVLLASATPSLETVINVESGKFDRISLASRYGKAVMPHIEVIDMRTQPMDRQTWISPPLRAALAETLAKEKQSLLFLNRRGYAPLTLCRHCGHRMMCPHCASWLVEHKSYSEPPQGRLECHHCGYTRKVPVKCPECDEKETMIACGPGVERVAEEVRHFLPQARALLMTRDSVKTAEDADRIVRSILERKVDVLIGTQMIAKGHHFPDLTLVGVIDADLGLAGGDLRAAERTYQLLHQVSGRAGRKEEKGIVFLQSYMPENNVIQALHKGLRDQFMQEEIQNRKQMQMPPFSRLIALVISGKKEEQVIQLSKQLAATTPRTEGVYVLGPVPAPLSPLRGRYRYRLLVKAERHINVQHWTRYWLTTLKIPAAIHVKIDVDPYNFL